MGIFGFLKKVKLFDAEIEQLQSSIHSDKVRIISDYLVFGVFSSDSYTPYYIYKLTNDKLYVDKRGTWHSDRHTIKGYTFEGELLSESKFEIAKELLFEIPLNLLNDKWKGFYTTGNKNEDKLILEFGESDYQKSITIDSYEIETEKLSHEIRDFRIKIENVLPKLNE